MEIVVKVSNGGSIWRMPKPSTPNSRKRSPPRAQASSQESFYEAIEILSKKGNKYLVAWAGIDPASGKQWEPSWVGRVLCAQVADCRNRKRIVVRLYLLLGRRNSKQRHSSRRDKRGNSRVLRLLGRNVLRPSRYRVLQFRGLKLLHSLVCLF